MADFSIGEQLLQDNLLLKEKVIPNESDEVVQLKSILIQHTRSLFQEIFGDREQILGSIAPGRVNLIGEHVDYCDGFVLPMVLLFAYVLIRNCLEHSTLYCGSRFNGEKSRRKEISSLLDTFKRDS